MLRVAVDARRLQDRPLTGAGRWLANVVPELVDDVELVLVTDGRRAPAALGITEFPLGFVPGLPEVAWFHARVGVALRAFDGVFHATFAAVPAGLRSPALVHINDLSFEHHPEDFAPAKRRVFAAQARRAAGRAGHVMTISEHARRSIVETYGVAPENITVAPPAVDPVFGPRGDDESRADLDRLGVRRPYVVAVGGARRRGLEVAVAAWRARPDACRGVGLVVVGAEVPPVEDGIRHLGRVGDADWSAVLAGARALCYPTRFEGYGMPALEAAASGVPVVCAPVGPLPEVLGEAAEWCETASPAAIGAGLARLLVDEERRRAVAAAGLARVAGAPTWSDAAAKVLAAYRKVADG